eukprot:gnl/TRDRNA2_/TRDRNA2_72535_c0_seq1.p1 gnl/TRDRNA2_/TRDRNA2_72535_c0~~gnl/TRDRNA2_/TRDRNA2_72535_c0_seq1.p1  ORF type:complete len:162 (-),score=19.48 gnl/TRDRNA2_/TRDRNA2_72535_c0_seq1:83-568(-)
MGASDIESEGLTRHPAHPKGKYAWHMATRLSVFFVMLLSLSVLVAMGPGMDSLAGQSSIQGSCGNSRGGKVEQVVGQFLGDLRRLMRKDKTKMSLELAVRKFEANYQDQGWWDTWWAKILDKDDDKTTKTTTTTPVPVRSSAKVPKQIPKIRPFSWACGSG